MSLRAGADRKPAELVWIGLGALGYANLALSQSRLGAWTKRRPAGGAHDGLGDGLLRSMALQLFRFRGRISPARRRTN